MNFYYNCYICHKKFNYQENYCESCLNRINNDQTTVFNLIESIVQKKKENSIQRKRIENIISQDDIVKLENIRASKLSLINNKKYQIQQLKDRIVQLKSLNDEESQNIEKRMKFLSKRRTTLKSNKTAFINVDQNVFAEQTLEIEKEKSHINQLNQLVQSKKKSLVEILTIKILKFKPSPKFENHFNIINILFNDFDFKKYPKDIIFITLGYIARISNLLSYFLGVVMPNEMIYKGSNTYIQRYNKKYPLFYHKSTQTSDYQKALHLLGENISFLRYFYGIYTPVESYSHFLTNLFELIRSPSLGKDKLTNITSSSNTVTNEELYNDEDWELVDPNDDDIDVIIPSTNVDQVVLDEYIPTNNNNNSNNNMNNTTNNNMSNSTTTPVSNSPNENTSMIPRRNSLLALKNMIRFK
ncbi:hypothetical protein DLAC_01799 [Tieghemostelium lacteum]|uniref:Autophagy-related protein 14 n=1 Tax=Tieghemostelium lacteum TaxID=361077 RepID=A0A152A6T8_TIELA|nr:hypothetical protein DLAC_01799 [Tieghemostelium lacteum]|eukprot:KYR01787.1 hypothetical protein DLAC_01799 [Tieghemostelium lacteum]